MRRYTRYTLVIWSNFGLENPSETFHYVDAPSAVMASAAARRLVRQRKLQATSKNLVRWQVL